MPHLGVPVTQHVHHGLDPPRVARRAIRLAPAREQQRLEEVCGARPDTLVSHGNETRAHKAGVLGEQSVDPDARHQRREHAVPRLAVWLHGQRAPEERPEDRKRLSSSRRGGCVPGFAAREGVRERAQIRQGLKHHLGLVHDALRPRRRGSAPAPSRLSCGVGGAGCLEAPPPLPY